MMNKVKAPYNVNRLTSDVAIGVCMWGACLSFCSLDLSC